ncbi:psbP domain-containing protein 4, chloroplastic isoform X2 [Cryptomeria japonica]|uniref:psbP domain-containing protein 4, chloroplastic isoform X2 n=1 Tax=Cryptomeria japonica TaxID=3369 RepID=UPI0027D9D673|nr:psbP domain-containing protein 4, chloroplastic isoform X2 [Cryptomeria japonica]
MIVLAGCNYETKILGAASWSDSLSKYHLILRRQAFISGSRIGFKSPCTIKTSTRFSKNYRLPVLEATPLVAGEEENGKDGLEISRRFTVMLGFPMLAAMVGFSEKALAVKQLQLAGRVPGLSPPDENDLGGTEIDLRFSNKKEGNVSVVVAPVLRFADSDDNVKIENIGTPEKLIYAFGPELVGQNVEGKLKSAEVKELSGKTYYQYELEAPHALVSATAAGNRLYLMTVSGNGLQWKKYLPNLKQIADSFRVD